MTNTHLFVTGRKDLRKYLRTDVHKDLHKDVRKDLRTRRLEGAACQLVARGRGTYAPYDERHDERHEEWHYERHDERRHHDRHDDFYGERDDERRERIYMCVKYVYKHVNRIISYGCVSFHW